MYKKALSNQFGLGYVLCLSGLRDHFWVRQNFRYVQKYVVIGAGIGLSTTIKGKFELKSFQIGDVKSYLFARVFLELK